MEVGIVPKSVTPVFTFDKLWIRSVNTTLFQTSTVYVQLHFIDPSGFLEETQCNVYRTITLTTEEYNNWTTDEYLINLVLTKLALTKS